MAQGTSKGARIHLSAKNENTMSLDSNQATLVAEKRKSDTNNRRLIREILIGAELLDPNRPQPEPQNTRKRVKNHEPDDLAEEKKEHINVYKKFMAGHRLNSQSVPSTSGACISGASVRSCNQAEDLADCAADDCFQENIADAQINLESLHLDYLNFSESTEASVMNLEKTVYTPVENLLYNHVPLPRVHNIPYVCTGMVENHAKKRPFMKRF